MAQDAPAAPDVPEGEQTAVADAPPPSPLTPEPAYQSAPGPDARARTIAKLGLLLPGVLRVVELRRLHRSPARWEVVLTEADEQPSSGALGEVGPVPHSMRAFLTFETDDMALLQQLRPRRLRLAVDLLELQRGGPMSGVLDLP